MYDVIVIGVGSAGSRAAVTAQREGARVLAIEGGEELGGLCILRGCMPTKTLLETAHRVHDIRDAKRFGIEVGEPRIDFGVQMERMRKLVKRFQRAKIGGVEGGGYELRWGQPRFTGPHTIELDGEQLEAKAFVISTGSRTRDFPVPVPQGVRLLTSDDMFLLERPPASALVVGAGAVGLEFAQWLARMGTRVVLSVRSRLLHRTDLEMGEELTRALSDEMEVCAGSQCLGIEATGDGGARVRLRQADGSEVEREVQVILNAVGRIPNLRGLELDQAGLTDDLQLDEGFRTRIPHIFVAGDTTGSRLLLHEANLEGEVAGTNAARVARGQEDLVEYDSQIPPLDVIFTDPVVANLGRTPQQLEAEGVAFASALKRFGEQGRGIVMGAEYGFLRLVAEPGGGKVLGCQILGPRADDLIHIPATVMRMGGTVRDLYGVPWYHPTLAEAFIEVCRKLMS